MKIVSGSAFFLAIFGCGIISLIFGLPDRYIKRDVQVSEMVGTWNITADSESKINRWMKDDFPGTPAIPWRIITLNSDGTCQVKVESAWFLHRIPLSKEVTAIDMIPCSWKLTKISSLENKDVTGIYVKFDHINSYIDEANALYLFEENGELILWTFIGDPDDFSLQNFKKAAK